MPRTPPHATLFPYTTLFRSQRATTDIVTTANGLRLLFRVAPGVEEELRQLAELERDCCAFAECSVHARGEELALDVTDRKSTRLNSSHVESSYAVFCLKKK